MENQILLEIIEVLHQASSVEPAVQEKVTHAIHRLSSHPESPAYFSVIFGDPSLQVDDEIRIRAGLLLKNQYQGLRYSFTDSPTHQQNLPTQLKPEILEVVKPRALKQLTHPTNPLMRSTSVSILISLLASQGIHTWPEAINQIMQLLGSPEQEIFDTAFATIMGIVDDGLESLPPLLTQTALNNEPANAAFIDFCRNRLVPKLLQVATDFSHETFQKKALSCLTNFVSHLAFADGFILECHFPAYWGVLGNLGSSTNTTPELRRDVLSGMIEVLTFNEPAVLADGEAVCQFIINCSSDADYKVRLQATEFWATALRSPTCLPLLSCHLSNLIPLLLANLRYTNNDYIQMDSSLFSPTNFNEPDLPQDIPPQHYRPDEDDDDDDDQSAGDDAYTMPTETAWGNAPTLRKAAASVLDNLGSNFGDEVLRHMLPLVEQRITSTEWEVKESVILALGAVAPSCLLSLDPMMPQILHLVMNCCEDPTPLLRSISVWFIARVFPWTVTLEHREVYFQPLIEKVLKHMLDSNKRVQEAACSSFCVIEEKAKTLLFKVLPQIVETVIRAFQTYQVRNLLTLLDSIASLTLSLGPPLKKEMTVIRPIVDEIMRRWENMHTKDPSCVPLMEVVTALANSLEDEFIPFSPIIFKRCTEIFHRVLKKVTSKVVANPNEGTDFTRLNSRQRDLLEGSMDVLAAAASACGKQAPLCMSEYNIMPYLELIITRNEINYKTTTRQCAYALVGDLARVHPNIVQPHLEVLMPHLLSSIVAGPTTVTNNAAWAVGEIAVHCSPDLFMAFAPSASAHLCRLLLHSHISHISVLRNAALTFGRVAAIAPDLAAVHAGECMEQWLQLLMGANNDADKSLAVTGVCRVMQSNVSVVRKWYFQTFETFASCFNPSPPDNFTSGGPKFSFALNPDIRPVIRTLLLRMNEVDAQEYEIAFAQCRPRTVECIALLLKSD